MDPLILEQWLFEENYPFSGWDFSHLDGRWQDEPLPWDYDRLVRSVLSPTDRILDMGTGGGEYLLSLGHPPHLTSVTESWDPNICLCIARLTPLGIEVKKITEDSSLPFPDNEFDLILNRHESYHIDEIMRILKPGGRLITQQVGGKNNISLSAKLIPRYQPALPDFCLAAEKHVFHEKGFEILFADEFFGELTFKDVGAVVYYAKVLPWEFPAFSVKNNYEQLRRLQQELEQTGSIKTNEHRFILIVKKPKSVPGDSYKND